MKYLCLVYGDESAIGKLDDMDCLDFDQSIRDTIAWMVEDGRLPEKYRPH